MLRNRLQYSLINIFGLGIGAAVCLLMIVFIQDELSYDRFHEKSDRIYRLTDHFALAGREYNTAGTPFPWGPAMQETFPEIEEAVRAVNTTQVIEVDNDRFVEDNVFFADSTFYDIFDFPLVAGNEQTALDGPNSVVLTEEMAQKYFGDDDPMGQTLEVGDSGTYMVTGVMKNFPSNSHFYPDFVIPFSAYNDPMIESWTRHVANYTFILLAEGSDPAMLAAQFPDFLKANMDPELVAQRNYRPQLQQITDIHLRSDLFFEAEPNGSITYIYLFSAIALFILLIACVNFVNLATARSIERAKEVGLRKVMGAERKQLITQFMGEAIALSLFALVVAFILAILGRPVLSSLVGRDLGFNYGGTVLIGLLSIGIFIGLVGGSYPALFLSRFSPMEVFRGRMGVKSSGGLLRKGLVVFQFSISVILIVGTLIIHNQLQYLQNKDLGFQDEQIVLIPMGSDEVQDRRAFIKSDLERSASIEQIATSSSVPGWGFPQQVFRVKGMPEDEQLILPVMIVDHDFLSVYELELVEGRGFALDFPSDSSGFVINEAAAQKLGWHDGATGEMLEWWRGTGRSSFEMQKEGPVLGVMKDFHFQSLHEEIQPLIFHVQPDGYGVFSVKVQADDMSATLAFIEETMSTYSTEHIFEYFFVEEEFASYYESERRLSEIFMYFVLLAILIACLGLFALASFITTKRTKEVGVRKVLGASPGRIMVSLTKDFLLLVIIACGVAIPIAYIGMGMWLENFAFRVDVGVGTFLLATVIALGIALTTIGYHVFKAVRMNPVESLRYD